MTATCEQYGHRYRAFSDTLIFCSRCGLWQEAPIQEAPIEERRVPCEEYGHNFQHGDDIWTLYCAQCGIVKALPHPIAS